jgi:hypothetical protein
MATTLRLSLKTLIAIAFAFSGTQPQRPQAHLLDFTQAPPALSSEDSVRSREASLTRSLPTSWRSDAPPVPLQVTLVELDRTGYAIGDSVLYDVTLKHVGTKPFLFPWSRRTSEFSRVAPVTRRAAVLLTIKDEMLGSQLIGSDNVSFGAESVDGSLLVLQPGDTVTVRAQGRWYLQAGMPAPPPDGWVRNVAVKAQLQIEGLNDYIPIVQSSNEIEIQLQQRR